MPAPASTAARHIAEASMPPAKERLWTAAYEQQLQVAAGAAAAVLEVAVPSLHQGVSWRVKLLGRLLDPCFCAVVSCSHALR